MDKLTRRNFLLGFSKFGIAYGVVDLLIENIINSQFHKLIAGESVAGSDFKYLGVFLPGGPPRWMFDGVLDLKAEGQISVGNKLVKNVDGYLVPGFEPGVLPPIWSNNKVKGLEDNSIFIRGVEAAPIHSDRAKQFSPQSGVPGIHCFGSLLNSNFPIPCVQWGLNANLNHPTKRNSAIISSQINVNYSAEDLASEIISPFSSKIVANLNDQIDQKIEIALGRFAEMGKTININSNKMVAELKAAKILINKNLENLITSGKFTEIVDQYQAVVSEGIKTDLIEGINDWFIDGSLYYDLGNKSLWKVNSSHTVKNNFTKYNFAKASNDTLVASLAISQFCFENEITNSMLVSAGRIKGLAPLEINPDAHDAGAIASTVYFSRFYMGLARGIKKLRANLFPNSTDNHIIHISSEFSRSAQASGNASDHGTNSSVHTIISNKILENKIIGDLKITGKEGDFYYGSWGQALTPIKVRQVHSTICSLMGLDPSYSFDDDSLISNVDIKGSKKRRVA